MGVFGGSGGGSMRGLASRTDAQFQDVIGQVGAQSDAAQDSAVRPLEAQAELLKKSQDFRDPLMEESLNEGLRQRAKAAREKANVAAGPTGSARADSSRLDMEAVSRGLLQHRSNFEQRRQTDIKALTSILSNTGALKSQFTTAKLGNISTLQASRLSTVAGIEQAAIEADNQPSFLANMLAAGVSSFAGSETGGNLIGSGIEKLWDSI